MQINNIFSRLWYLVFLDKWNGLINYELIRSSQTVANLWWMFNFELFGCEAEKI